MRQDRIHLIWAILPVLPLIFGFAALAILDGPTSELRLGLQELLDAKYPVNADGIRAGGLFIDVARDVTFLNALFVYVSVGLIHLFVCLAVIFYMAQRSWTMPRAQRDKTLIVLFFSVAILVLVNVLAREDGLRGALSLAYRNICDVVVMAQVAPQIMPGSCTEPGISDFAWLAALPYLLGLLAAAFASAVVSGVVSDIAADVKKRISDVTLAFHATALVLVTSMLAMVLFYQLPLAVISEPDSQVLASSYADGITVYWGALFTVTLAAIFGPANYILRQQVQDTTPEEVTIDGPRMFIDARTRQMLGNVLATLSPLLIGSAGSFFETITTTLTTG